MPCSSLYFLAPTHKTTFSKMDIQKACNNFCLYCIAFQFDLTVLEIYLMTVVIFKNNTQWMEVFYRLLLENFSRVTFCRFILVLGTGQSENAAKKT